VGEVDLTKQVRPPERTYLASLAELIVGTQPRTIGRIYLSEKVANEFKEMQPEEGRPTLGDLVEVHGVKDIDSLVIDLWPSLTK